MQPSVQPGYTAQFVVALQGVWRLYDGGATAARIAAARDSLAQAQAEYDRQLSQAELDVREAYVQLQTADERVAATRDLAASAGEDQRLAEIRYRGQVGTQLELRDAQARSASARQQLIRAQADLRIADAHLRFVAGIDERRSTIMKSRVLILGAGFAGHTAALHLSKHLDEVDVTVVSPRDRFTWFPSLIWVGVGTMSPERCHFASERRLRPARHWLRRGPGSRNRSLRAARRGYARFGRELVARVRFSDQRDRTVSQLRGDARSRTGCRELRERLLGRARYAYRKRVPRGRQETAKRRASADRRRQRDIRSRRARERRSSTS